MIIQALEKYQLFFTGFLQVVFVAMNTVFISKNEMLLVLIASFCISFIWSSNVKKIAIGGMRDRIVYSLGASIGGITGVAVAYLMSGV